MDTPIYYHGGIGGKLKGEFILPPSITGKKCSSDLVPDNNPHRRDKVYITTSIEAAAMYAATSAGKYKPGIYQVEPFGELEVDPDYIGDDEISFQCDKAQILKKMPLSQNEINNIREIVLQENPVEQ